MPATYTPLNTFDSALISKLVTLCGSLVATLDSTVQVVPGFRKTKVKLPRVVFTAMDMEEVIYQSGNYRINVQTKIEVDIDHHDTLGEPLFATVLDFWQQTDLKTQLMTGTKLNIKGIVLNRMELADPNELRAWSKTIENDVFGHMLP